MLISVSISVLLFGIPVVIVLYIVILDIYKIYNFFTKLTAFSLFYAVLVLALLCT